MPLAPTISFGGLTFEKSMADTPEKHNILSRFRRPQTSDDKAFWYVAPEKWNEWIAQASDPTKRKASLQKLRKNDAAGRIMETDEGVEADEPCTVCNRQGLGVQCKVFKTYPDTNCAYCRRQTKGACNARMITESVLASIEPPLPASSKRDSTIDTLLWVIFDLKKELVDLRDEYKSDHMVLRDQVMAQDGAFQGRIEANNASLLDRVRSGEASLKDRMNASETNLRDQMREHYLPWKFQSGADTAALQEKLDKEISRLETENAALRDDFETEKALSEAANAVLRTDTARLEAENLVLRDRCNEMNDSMRDRFNDITRQINTFSVWFEKIEDWLRHCVDEISNWRQDHVRITNLAWSAQMREVPERAEFQSFRQELTAMD